MRIPIRAMKAIPVVINTSPINAKSNMPNTGKSCFLKYAFTAMLVEVPMTVHVPPSMDANAKGIKSFDGLIRSLRAIAITGETYMAVTVVLFMKADVMPTIDMI
jgi:hypothetical protein